jgi:hypothetical protein
MLSIAFYFVMLSVVVPLKTCHLTNLTLCVISIVTLCIKCHYAECHIFIVTLSAVVPLKTCHLPNLTLCVISIVTLCIECHYAERHIFYCDAECSGTLKNMSFTQPNLVCHQHCDIMH